MKRDKNSAGIAKAKDDKGGDKLFRLTDIEPEFVSLVQAGANRQKSFMVVKEDAADKETKCQAQQDRSAKYGIEAKEDGNLSFPSDDPTTETMYGDPVNLKYPLGGAANTPDPERLHNALVSFSQGMDEYKQQSSKAKILERIIEASLTAGIAVTYQDNDIYAALPADLKERIKEKEDANKHNDGNEPLGNGSPGKDAVDLASWLDEAGTKVDALTLDHAVAAALNTPAEVPAVDVGGTSKEAQEIEDAEAPAATEAEKKTDEEQLGKMHQLEDKLKKAEREIVSLKAKNARLSKGVGKSSVILTGEVTAKGLQKEEDNENTSPSRGAFLSGGDIAAAIAKSGG